MRLVEDNLSQHLSVLTISRTWRLCEMSDDLRMWHLKFLVDSYT